MVTWLPIIKLELLQEAKVVAMDNETVHRKAIRISPRIIDEWVLGIGFLRNGSAFPVPILTDAISYML